MVVTVALPLFRKDHWTFRAFEFPRVQKFVLLIFCIALGFAVMDYTSYHFYAILLVLILSTTYCGYLIFPFSPLGRKTLPSARGNESETLSLLISNVYQFNSKYHKLKQHIRERNADILMMVETDEDWQEGLNEVTQDYPYKMEMPLNNTYGILFYSKLELKNDEFRFLVNDEYPSIRTTLITREGREILFYGLHPPPPSPTEETYATARDSELVKAAYEIDPVKDPVIAAGDLNDVAWSFTTDEFLRISGLLDPRKGRGVFATFHANHVLLRWPLDHIFCSPHFRLKHMTRLKSIGSDHFPVYVELAIK